MTENKLKEIKIIKTPSAYPYYLAGGVWIAASFLFPMYKLSSLFFCAALAIAGYLIGTRLFPAKEEVVEIIKEEQYASEAIRITVEEGIRLLDQLSKVNQTIEHEAISNQIIEIQRIATEILNTIKGKAGSVQSMRKLLNYYLPTTLKLLQQYSDLEKRTIKVDNIQESMDKIEKMMHLIVQAFQKQLDHLYEGEAMDISAEITVMESMMATEGLIEKNHPSKKEGM